MACILSSRYVYQADIYKKTVTKNSSGQLVSNWVFDRTIACYAETIVDGGVKSAATTEVFNMKYENVDWVKITSAQALRRSDRVTNIRHKATQQVVWKEEEIKNNPPTWFNSNGSAPINDPFGRTVEHKTLIKRAEVQGNGN